MKQIIFIIFLSFLTFSSAQPLDKLYDKIETKIKEDNTYLNLYYYDFQPGNQQDVANFKEIPKANNQKISFGVDLERTLRYRLVFLPENIEFDELNLLEVREVTTPTGEGGNIFGSGENGGIIEDESKVVLNFEDVQNLFFEHKDIYDKLINLIESMSNEYEPQSMLNIKVDEEINKSRGISARNNKDFLLYHWVNDNHYYPNPSKQAARGRSSRAQALGDNPLIFSVSPDKITFFYRDYMEWDYNSLSVEVKSGNELLNIHPYESMTLSAGLRSLVFLSKNSEDPENDFIIDAKVLGRFPVDFSNSINSIPFVFADPPKLNLKGGVEIELSSTRPLGLPFLNFYFSSSAEDFKNPFVKFGSPDSSYAFFSFSQWLTTMSFYWNTSEARNLRLRLDLGVGKHNIIKATYFNGITREVIQNKMLPYAKLFVNFTPSGYELFSANLRYYDNIFKLEFWMKVVEIAKDHVIRVSASHITTPFFRSINDWENEGSTFVGINYRYGY